MLKVHGLLFWFFLIKVIVDASEKSHYMFIKDNKCYKSSTPQHQLTKFRNPLIDCARWCVNSGSCQYIIASAEKTCELLYLNKTTSQIQSSGNSNSLSIGNEGNYYKLTNPLDLNSAQNDNDASEFSLCLPDDDSSPAGNEDDNFTDLITSNFVTVVDTQDPHNPMNEAHFENLKQVTMPFESKCMFLDTSGVYHVLVNTDTHLENGNITGSLVYAMDKVNGSFVRNASRITFTCTSNGFLTQGLIHLNGSSQQTTTRPQRVKILVPRVSEYSLQAGTTQSDVNILITWLERGYRIHNVKIAKVWDSGLGISLYTINENLQMSPQGRPVVPISYRQLLTAVTKHKHCMSNALGSAGEFTAFQLVQLDSRVYLSPFWQSITNHSLSKSQQASIIRDSMLLGHRFRVSSVRILYDIDDVIKLGDEVYFLLPQNVKSSPRIFTNETVGVRAVLSLDGSYNWCSHPLEGERVIDVGDWIRGAPSEHFYFIDKKVWNPVLLVYSGGTVAFGNVKSLADAAMEGKDINVLVEWAGEDKARLFSASLLTIRNYGHPATNAVVIVESKVTWHLVPDANDDMLKMNTKCDMEKILVKSTGEVEVLVYNIHRQEPVHVMGDTIAVTWFVH